MASRRGEALAVALGVPLGLAAMAAVLTAMAPPAATPTALADAVVSPSATPSPTATAPSPTPSATPVPSADTRDYTPDAGAFDEGETLDEGGAPQRSDVNAADPSLQVLNYVETDDPVFFITIDDGLVKSPEALAVVEKYQIPVTAFLTEYAVRNDTEYFEAITRFGGSVQNHTMVHGALDNPQTDVRWEICETQDRFEEQFGYRPWMMRPPYGAGPNEPNVQSISAECGINRIVLWNIVVTDDNQVEYWEPPIKAGDIVLFHFVDDLAGGLEKIIQLGKEQGLTPAALEDYI